MNWTTQNSAAWLSGVVNDMRTGLESFDIDKETVESMKLNKSGFILKHLSRASSSRCRLQVQINTSSIVQFVLWVT